METIFYDALKTIGDETKLKNWRRVHGGDINEAFYLRTEQGEYFLKFRKNCPGRFFACERTGLEALRESGAVHVPKVYSYKDGKDYGYILLEWIEGKKSDRLGEKLGRQLANLHRIPQEFFGFPEDNYIGILPQKNGRFASWIEYYRECRLLPQIRMAEKKGLLPGDLRKKLDVLLENLDRYLPGRCTPSLLHGDLWGGNWIGGKNGEPYLIDPAVFYGHSEFEIAFTELFGGFPPSFYSAYQEILPLSDGYQDRKGLYQLFYLLVHVNLFGSSYVPSVKRVLEKYV